MKVFILGLLCLVSFFGLFFSCFPQIFVSAEISKEGQGIFGFICAFGLWGFGAMLGDAIEGDKKKEEES